MKKKTNCVIVVCIKDINLEGEGQAKTSLCKRWKIYQIDTLQNYGMPFIDFCVQ